VKAVLMRLKRRDPVLDFLSDVALWKHPRGKRFERSGRRPLDNRFEQGGWFDWTRKCRRDRIFGSGWRNSIQFRRSRRNFLPSTRDGLNECFCLRDESVAFLHPRHHATSAKNTPEKYIRQIESLDREADRCRAVPLIYA